MSDVCLVCVGASDLCGGVSGCGQVDITVGSLRLLWNGYAASYSLYIKLVSLCSVVK